MAVTVQQSASALLGILDDVLDVARLGAGKVELEEIEFDPRPLVGSVADLMRTKTDAKGIALTQEFAGVDAALCGDAGRLRQILMNFVSNAVKFTDRGGVTIAVT